MTQSDSESVTEFFDRMMNAAVRSHPAMASNGPDTEEMYEVIAHHFVHALKYNSMKRILLNDMPTTLSELKFRAQELESTELSLKGQQASASARSNLSQNGENKSRKNAKSNNAASNNHTAAVQQNKHPDIECHFCHEMGHYKKECIKLTQKLNGGNATFKSRSPCNRCGKYGHTTDECRSHHHKDGHELTPLRKESKQQKVATRKLPII